MRQVTRKGLITIAAAGGMLGGTGGYAHADSNAEGVAVGSPGVLSGNVVQAPIDAQVNACGNTVNVVGALNPAVGNTCVNERAHKHHGKHSGDGAEAQGAAAGSPGVASGNVVQVPIDAQVNACGNSVDVVGAFNPAAGNTCVNEESHEHPEPKPKEPKEPKEPGKPDGEKPEGPKGPGGEKPDGEKPHGGKPDGEKPHGGKPDGEKPRHNGPAGDKGPEAGVEDGGAGNQPVPAGKLAETGVGPELGALLPLGAGMLAGGVMLRRRLQAEQD